MPPANPSTSLFHITEHTSPAQHLREFPHALRSHEQTPLHLAVKEYRPVREVEPGDGEPAVTVVATHANGFPKECYEALWEELLPACQTQGVILRALWVADCAHQGASYALNAPHLGDDPNWFDHSRDLLVMVNHFRSRMVPPIVGVGHSMGAAQLVHLSHLHPRLFHSLALIEPVIQPTAPDGPNSALLTSKRREGWPTRSAAETSLRRNPFFATLDPRVLDAYLQHGLRESGDKKSIELSTPKAQESWSYVRPNFTPLPSVSSPETRALERLLSPDYLPFSLPALTTFTRPESLVAAEELRTLRPQTLFVYGADSHINTPELRAARLAITGTARGGSGGQADEAIEEHIVENAGHLVCFDHPADVANRVAEWLATQVQRWNGERAMWERFESGKSVTMGNHSTGSKGLSQKWLDDVELDPRTLREPESNMSGKVKL